MQLAALAPPVPFPGPGNEADRLFQQFHLGKTSMWQLRLAFDQMASPVLRGQKDPYGQESFAASKFFLARAVATQNNVRRKQILSQTNFDTYRRAFMFATLVNVGIQGAYKRYMSGKVSSADVMLVLEPESLFVRLLLAPGTRRTPLNHKRLLNFAEVARSILDSRDPDILGAGKSKLQRPVLVSLVARIEFIDRELINAAPL